MKLSIIIPVFNEEKTIAEVLKKVDTLKISGVEKEIILVDDGSMDKTRSIVERMKKKCSFVFIKHTKNLGKGSAVKSGISAATGDYIIIQDADFEYNPSDIAKLVFPVTMGKTKVVYGSRLKRFPNFFRDEKNFRFFMHYIGNKGLSLVTSLLYWHWLTDMETCYKLFPKEAVRTITLHSKGFEFEVEITAKLLKQGYKIIEIPITTNPRGYKDGKKLRTVRDGIKAFQTLFQYRFYD